MTKPKDLDSYWGKVAQARPIPQTAGPERGHLRNAVPMLSERVQEALPPFVGNFRPR